MLYGKRASGHILHPDYNFLAYKKSFLLDSDIDLDANEMVMIESDILFMDNLIISADNPIKSKFDIFVLLLVGYSCIVSIYNAAFYRAHLAVNESIYMQTWNWVVEGCFFADLILSFFHAYTDEERGEDVVDFDTISRGYLFGWFTIDFIACFPFFLIFEQGILLRLFRLARLPKMLKLLDKEHF